MGELLAFPRPQNSFWRNEAIWHWQRRRLGCTKILYGCKECLYQAMINLQSASLNIQYLEVSPFKVEILFFIIVVFFDQQPIMPDLLCEDVFINKFVFGFSSVKQHNIIFFFDDF